MKDVVLNEVKRKEKFENLLTKICLDLNIDNYKKEIEIFIERRTKKQ